MKKDFPELEGKAVLHIAEGGRYFSGVVVGCNYDVGITIVEVNNDVAPESVRHLLCLQGPLAPNRANNAPPDRIYSKMFFVIVDMIKKGQYIASDIQELVRDIGLNENSEQPSSETCAFSQ